MGTVAGMAGYTLVPIVPRVIAPQRLVRGVASQAGERPHALLETPALFEIGRLVPHIPGVGKIIGPGTALGRTVARTAQPIQILGGQRPRIADRLPGLPEIPSRGRRGVELRGPMTSLATNPHAFWEGRTTYDARVKSTKLFTNQGRRDTASKPCVPSGLTPPGKSRAPCGPSGGRQGCCRRGAYFTSNRPFSRVSSEELPRNTSKTPGSTKKAFLVTS